MARTAGEQLMELKANPYSDALRPKGEKQKEPQSPLSLFLTLLARHKTGVRLCAGGLELGYCIIYRQKEPLC